MTAKELIEVLKQADENAEVFFCEETDFPLYTHGASVGSLNFKDNNAVYIS